MKERLAPGTAIKGMIPLSIPEISGNEWKYVKECLDTGWVSSAGPFVERFEKSVARYLGREYAVACVSGTAALHVGLLLSGVRAGEEVLMPALTFAAPAFAVRYLGAWPVFIDVEPQYSQIDPQRLREFLSKQCRTVRGKLINKNTKRIVRAILPVHLLGHPADMNSLRRIAREFDLILIEDAAESLGAEYKGKKVGYQADISCLSFNGNKVITSGGGGMVVTDNLAWAEKARYLTTQAKDDPLEYVHKEIGYNYRLSNVLAAIGLAQMERLDEFVARKRKIAAFYHKQLKDISGILCPNEAPGVKSSFWLYTIRVHSQRYGMSSRELMRELERNGVQSRPLWHPLHTLAAFRGAFSDRIEHAEVIWREALSLPSSSGLRRQDLSRVAAAVALREKRGA